MDALSFNNTLIPQNPMDSKRVKGAPEHETSDAILLTAKQWEYQSYLEIRLARAQEVRDRSWPEFSRKTYLQQYQQNQKIAMTYVEPKVNEDDVAVASGTIEAKLNAVLSNIDNLNLTPEVHAYDKDEVILRDLGDGMTDILDRLAEHDGGQQGGDQEKRLLRQKELCVQGTVFVQDRWATKKKMCKVLKKKYDGTFNFSAWDTAWKTTYNGPDRTLLYGPNVYLGDITQFSMDDQPYIFTLETSSYDSAKTMFGEFENWKYVKKGMPPASVVTGGGIGGRTIFDGKFRLTSLSDNQVEIIRYQDPIRDEFQIMINGVMMMPIGFPLGAVTPGGKINIVKQVLYPINAQFAYGKAFVSSGDVYELSKLLDEFLGLFTLKTRKSITPAFINTSGKVVSKRVLSPGNITMGIQPGQLHRVDASDGQGVTAGEYQFYKELLDRIEKSTVGPTFQGQFAGSNTTATEVMEVQKQAKLSLGIIIGANTMLEVKLTYLRIPMIIGNYFEPAGIHADGEYNKYKSISRETTIDGAGSGMRRIIPIDDEEMPSKDLVRQLEILDEKADGFPSKRIYINPKRLKKAELTWKVVVVPRERESSAYEKLLFREQMADALALISLGSRPNVGGMEDEYSKVYGVDRNKFFASASDMSLGGNAAADPMADPAAIAGNSQSGNMPNMPGAPSLSPASGGAAPPGGY